MQVLSEGLEQKSDTSSLVIPILILGAGFVFLVFDVFISHSIPTAKSIALIAGGASYLLLRNRLHPKLAMALPVKPEVRLPGSFVVSNVVFFLLFAYTLYLTFTAGAYAVPVSYFVCAAAMCVILALDIFLMPEGREPYIYLTLAKIVAVSLLLIAVPHYFFPNIGQDFWEHSALVNDILGEGRIPVTGYPYYRDFLGMHFIVAAVKSVTKLNIQASMMTIGVFQVMSLLSLFCIGREVFNNNKVALLGALCAGFSAPFLFWGYYIIPMTLGIGLVLVLILLITRSLTANNKLPFMMLWLVISILMVYTHTVAGLIFLIVVVAMFLGSQFLHAWSRRQLPASLQFSTPLWFFFALMGYWVYISRYWFGELGKIIANAFSLPTFEAAGLPSDITPALLQEVSFAGFLGLAILASLFCWRYRKQYRYALLLAAAVVGLVITLSASGLAGRAELLLPDRWEPFIYVTIAPLSALGIFLLYNAAKVKAVKLSGVAILTLVLAFTMIATSLVGHSNPIVDEQQSYRIHWLDSEVAAASRITGFYDGLIISDEAYSTSIKYGYGRETEDIYPLITQGSEFNGALVIRKHILDYPFRTAYIGKNPGGYASYGTRLDEAQKQALESLGEEPGRNKIYDNGEVTTYLTP
jgi:hypothetical protein